MKKLICIILILSFIPIRCLASTNYFDVNSSDLVNFSKQDRTQAEQIVKAVAEEYLYKNYYTDYEQKSADIYSYMNSRDLTSKRDNYLNNTFQFRNLNMTPFALSRSNHNNFDCSSFVTNVYLNSFGFDFRDYYSSDYHVFYKSYVKPQYTNQNGLTDNSIYFKSYDFDLDSFLYSGRGPSTQGFETLQRQLESASTNNKLFVYTEENVNGISMNESKIQNLEKKFKTGDIFLIRRVDENGKHSGHVMIYVKDHISNSTEVSNGFIHSSGSDFPLENFDTNITSYGIDKYSVRYVKFANYINKYFPEHNGRKVIYISIIRPLNVILNSSYTNAYTNTKTNKTTKNIMTLGKKSYSTDNNGNISDDYKISMQQYLYNNTQEAYINNTNVVNDQDEISIKAYVKNKGTKTRSVTLKMNYIDNNVLSYVIYGCNSTRYQNSNKVELKRCSSDQNITVSKNNGIITFTIKNMKPKEDATLYYKVKYNSSTNQEKLTIPGMSLYFGEDTSVTPIKFNDLTITGSKNSFTKYEGNSSENVIKKINSYYFSNGNSVNRSKSLLRMYNEVFGINLSDDLGNIDAKTSTTVRKIIAGLFQYKTSDNDDVDKVNGFFYNPNNQKIEKYVVKGMYGGSLVRSNIDKERTHRLTFEMLEPGDIVVVFNSANNKKFNNYIFVYGGYKNVVTDGQTEKKYVLYFRQKNVYVTTDKSLNILKRALASEAFVVLRPTQVSNNHFVSNLSYIPRNEIIVSRLNSPLDLEPEDDVDDDEVEGSNQIILSDSNVIENTTIGQEEDLEKSSDDTEIESNDVSYEEDEEAMPDVYNVPNTALDKKLIVFVLGILLLSLGLITIKRTNEEKES